MTAETFHDSADLIDQLQRKLTMARLTNKTLLNATKIALLEFDRISYQIKANPEVIELLNKIVAKAECE